MRLGKVIGKVWATRKDPQFTGIKLYVMVPVDENHKPMDKPIIAADIVGSTEGDIVFWVGAREATLGLPEKHMPSDATIVGILDSTYAAPRDYIEKRKKTWLAGKS
jgi:ethanolamine utilization protein EutN